MPIPTGTRLGPYEVLAPLGAGGMGEVYRARDTRLDRTVALKLLLDTFAGDAERLARFEREARLLASLTHPNIAVLHGLEQDAERRFIVMEFVEGASLADRVRAGALPVDEALDVARQVATALEAAHDAGIVHRDLKPANVMLTPAGVAKVLDFGLAKGGTGSPSDSSLSISPTRTFAATQDGVILGTAAYMSPEQARGKAVDRRTDIWAFGCLLYECLTGRQAFEGETVSDLIASILKGTIDWDALPADTPARVRELLHRCLERDPRQRLRDIGEARLVLEQPHANATPAAAAAPARPALPVPALAVGAVLLAALAAVAAWSLKPAPHVPVTWAELIPPPSMLFDGRAGGDGAVSPDGRWYAASVVDSMSRRRLSVRDLESGAARLLDGTEEARYPFWSPDSRSLGFFAAGKLLRFDLDGGAITPLAPAADARGGSWSNRGLIVFAPGSRSGLRAVAASGGEVRVLVPDSATSSYRFPHFLPDGRHFTVGYMSDQTFVLEVRSVDGSAPRRLPLPPSALINLYYANGRLFYCDDHVLRARPFDPARGVFTGEAVTVTTPIASTTLRGRGDFSVGGDGTIVYRAQRATEEDLISVRDRSGARVRDLSAGASLQDLQLSPDGKRLLVSVAARTGAGVDVWSFDVSNGAGTRMTFDEVNDDAIWSPDGRQIAWSNSSGAYTIFTRAAGGAGEPVAILRSSQDTSPTDWPDETTLIYTAPDTLQPGKYDALWALDLASGTSRALVNGGSTVRHGRVSPDGRWLAYSTMSAGDLQVFVADYPGLQGRWQVSTHGGSSPLWRKDGRELYYLDREDRVVAASVSATEGSPAFGVPAVLFKHGMGLHSANRIHSWAVSGDGQRFYMLEPVEPVEARPPLTLIRGWWPPRAGK